MVEPLNEKVRPSWVKDTPLNGYVVPLMMTVLLLKTIVKSLKKIVRLLNVMVGATLSFTEIVCVQDEWFPELSVAVQVIVVVPNGYGSVRGLPSLRLPLTLALPQLSEAVGLPGLTCAAQVPGSSLAVM